MIGITFALPRESANLRRQLSEVRQDGDLISGRIDHREVAIVDSVVERNEIARRSGAEAVDMETGAIAGVCNAHGVPLLSLRAISDSPTEPFPVAAHILFDIEQQRPNYGRLAVYLLRDPAS